LKKNFLLLSVTISACCILFNACKDETVEPSNEDHYRYFPLTSGFWTEYVVDSIYHRDGDEFLHIDSLIDTFHFYLREIIDTPFLDATNETAWVVERWKREADTMPWEFQNIITAKRNAVSAQRVEDNIRFLKMQFPISASALWNGNAYNYYPEEDYTYDDLYEQRTYNGLTFPSTVKIIQNDFLSLINRVSKEEIYAKDIGMIFKQLDSVTFAYDSNGLLYIEKGLEYKRTITGYKQ
jgi:hypothetical protein